MQKQNSMPNLIPPTYPYGTLGSALTALCNALHCHHVCQGTSGTHLQSVCMEVSKARMAQMERNAKVQPARSSWRLPVCTLQSGPVGTRPFQADESPCVAPQKHLTLLVGACNQPATAGLPG
jgi:hypothetical protein